MAEKFRGHSIARVDEKGRLKLSADFKRVVDAEYGPQFYITSFDGKRMEIYPMRVWEEKEERLMSLPSTNPLRKRYLDRTAYYGQVAEMDAQGRLLLPQPLRDDARLMGEVMVKGAMTTLEVLNHAEFRAEMLGSPVTAEDEEGLAALGI